MNNLQQPRRKFLYIGVAGLFTTLLANFPKIGFAKPFRDNKKGIIVREDEGIHILTRRKVPITIQISKTKDGIDNISFCREDMAPGRKMRVHKHLNNDKLIFVHKGEGTLTLDERTIEVKTGTVIFVPRGHGMDWIIQAKRSFKWFFSIHPPGLKNIS